MLGALLAWPASGQDGRAVGIWDRPAIGPTQAHAQVAADGSLLADFVESGRQLFEAHFNVLDGFGRPTATGDSKPTIRLESAPLLNRVAGPDASSCAGCHNQPLVGGAGGAAANVFVGAHFTDPPTHSTELEVTNERNTIGVFGAGVVEMLAREMSADLLALRAAGFEQATRTGQPVTVALETKGVRFGSIVTRPDGTYDAKGLEGVDEDLIVKPFGAKGVAVSLREFTVFALNQHHGIQAQERFGWERTGMRDFDGDGVEVEMDLDHVSALTVYQAALPAPVRVVPGDPVERAWLELGERRFVESGCGDCHVPSLPLRARSFTEPNRFNRPGTALPEDLEGAVRVPFEAVEGSALHEGEDGYLRVAAFTDLKRHRICDDDDPFFCNERLPQDFVPTDEFLTPKLWDLGSSAPYGHRGDLTTISEAIVHHSGEARASRTAFLALQDDEKAAVVAFLQSLQVRSDEPRTTR